MSLRKEMFIAIFLGLTLGGGAAFLFARIPQNLFGTSQEQPTPIQNNVPTPSPTPLQDQSIKLEILFPAVQAIVDEETINVSGKTQPGIDIAVTSAVDEVLTTSNEQGTFSVPIDLTEGANELIIVAMGEDEIVERIIPVNYTSEDL